MVLTKENFKLMKNVYDEIQLFYDECIDFDGIIEQASIEKYLRKKAWRGNSDEDLKHIWKNLQWFIYYLDYIDLYDLNELSDLDYAKSLFWIAENNDTMVLNEESVKDFFAILEDFYRYLLKEKQITQLESLRNGKKHFFVEEQFTIPEIKSTDEEFYENLHTTKELSMKDANKLNVLLEKLLNKIGLYYKNEEFSFDFNRALSLYSGPFNVVPEEDGEEFWLGFWDYYLFDYHLVKNDSTPLRYFYESKKDVLTADEKHILNDLLRAKFTVFYINRLVNESVVECTNLLTDEKIQLPTPDYGLHDYKKVILYGHIYLDGVVMLNYITSIPASTILRKRIKEEIMRQQCLYKYQDPEVNIEQFFERHAIMVRHTIDILVHLAKVNVVAPELLLHQFPTIKQTIEKPDEAVTLLLQSLAKRYKFSLHATDLLLKMWGSFFNSFKSTDRAEFVAAGIFLSFATINGVNFINKKNFLKKLAVSDKEFSNSCKKIAEALQLRVFDPRYLTEEGFVLSLYAF